MKYQSFENGDEKTKTVTPLDEDAERLFQLFNDVKAAEKAFETAFLSVPEYTGQYSPIDFYGDALDARNKAWNAFTAEIKRLRASS